MKKNHISPLIKADIRNIKESDFPNEVDGIIGGSPCQSWSEAGFLRGLEDSRGQLFYDYIRILKDKQPKFFWLKMFLECFLIDTQKPLKILFLCLRIGGYNISITMVNAADYGVPQDRKRVFYIGFRKDLNINFVFPLPTTPQAEQKKTMRDAIGNLVDTAIPALPKNKTNSQY